MLLRFSILGAKLTTDSDALCRRLWGRKAHPAQPSRSHLPAQDIQASLFFKVPEVWNV